jgi:DNA-binding SARP family transcriptional activator
MTSMCSEVGEPTVAAIVVPRVPEVVVRVLGPVEIVGAARPFRRAWCTELVTYLALHPEGASTDAWTTALWPDRLASEATRFSTVSEARRGLGRASDGSDHLPHGVGRLRLTSTVTTDWAQFRSLAAARGPGALAAWTAALELVRGAVLGGLRASDWTVLEGLSSAMEGAVVELAIDAAEQLLAVADGRGAERLLRRALRVAPYDERLYRLLFAAADRQGNPSAVESTMNELVQLLSGERRAVVRSPSCRRADLDEWVHPETVAAYLTHNPRARVHVAKGQGHRS